MQVHNTGDVLIDIKINVLTYIDLDIQFSMIYISIC